jgi:signal transduction histidine kinase
MESIDLCWRFVATICFLRRATRSSLIAAALLLVCLAPASQGKTRKNVLMINEVGYSHPGPVLVTNMILVALHSDPRFDVEFQWENLDAADISDDSRNKLRDSVIEKYRNSKLDLIVLVGPDPLRFLSEPSKNFYIDVPVVFCCSVPGQVAPRTADPRSTGSWLQLDPAKTLDAALRLLPDTRRLFVVAGQSQYDRGLTALVKAGLNSYQTRLDVTYLTDLPMNELLEELRHLPNRSIVIFVSFFKDVQGRSFMNANEALPLITAASRVPVFGVSDTYLGRGVVGGFTVSFEEQGKIAARNVLEILGGKPPQDIPVVYGHGAYLFDWHELRRWKLDQRKLPSGSTVLFREATLWERHKWTVLTGLLILVSLSLVTMYLLFEQKQLKAARVTQEQLSGRLINAQEAERSRLASEIHDDFSQRLALLALGLGTAAKIIPESPQEANHQLEELSNEAGNIGRDLHTLSHRLHSSTLKSLGLVAGVSAFCKEFSATHKIRIDFTPDATPKSVNPDVALCIFRIVQECLRNTSKHSGASCAHINLKVVDSTIHLAVSDDGVGFNPKDLKQNEGLGVRSMAERAHLLGGRFEIRSEAGKGTIVDVRLPLHPQSSALTA